jgi:hypothetical protein
VPKSGTHSQKLVAAQGIPKNNKVIILVSEAPSYHSTAPSQDVAPTYTATVPTANPAAETPSRRVESHMANTTPEPLGLPPIPALPRSNNSLLQNYRLPTWPTANAPAAMHYRKVAERRVVDGRYQNPLQTRHQSQGTHVRQPEEADNGGLAMLRPLEDPYLVGEEAAAQARRERIGRETSSDVLQREDRHWDWLIGKSCYAIEASDQSNKNANVHLSPNERLGRTRT